MREFGYCDSPGGKVRLLILQLAILSLFTWFAMAQSSEKGTDEPSLEQHAGHESQSHDAQDHDAHDHQMQGMDMPGMEIEFSIPDWMPSPHASSGTSWQPATAPSHVWMKQLRHWNVMAHGAAFLDYTQSGGPRGAGKADSVNWLMLMEQHTFAGGTILFRQMLSAESLTAPHPGFPELFQTGETYHSQPLVDHQHPHNVFAELAMYYSHPVSEKVSWLFYGGPAAEPALGPPTYLHRASATELPMAPLSHHLQDSTHTSFGVITTGLVVERFKVEGSLFNGREPNEKRYGIQFASLDSWSARLSVAPGRTWTAEYSYGRLEHPEALEPGSERRQSASVEYVRPLERGAWATAAIWGRKHKEVDNRNLNSYLLESTLNFWDRDYLFSRLELVDKDELFPNAPLHPGYRIGAYTLGGARDVIHNPSWQLALGADLTLYSKPAVLDAAYGDNPVSFQVFLRIRRATSDHQR
jgi:hypothetical protein